MMKKTLYAILTAALAVIMASCEKEIEFNGNETKQRIVLYSQAIPGEPLTANISASLFFLEQDMSKYTSALDTAKGTVKVYVNDALTPYVMAPVKYEPESPWDVTYTIQYVSDYVPQCGDAIRIVADFPGFDQTVGETFVPKMPDFEIVNIRKTRSESEGYTKYDVSARLKDDASYSKYYSLSPMALAGVGWMDNVFDFNSSDIIFNSSTTSELYSMLLEEGKTSRYFSDNLIKGSTHDFNFNFEVSDYWLDCCDEDTGLQTYEIKIGLTVMSESFYWYLLSKSQLNNNLGFFSEGITLYSNVKGGYGCVCSSVSLYLQTE